MEQEVMNHISIIQIQKSKQKRASTLADGFWDCEESLAYSDTYIALLFANSWPNP